MLTELTAEEKLRLIRFTAAFAWADLDIAEKERAFVLELIERMGLDAANAATARAWLDHPPSEDDLDPYSIPDDHKKVFLEAALEMMGADGVVDRMEVENFAIFEALMGVDDDDTEGPTED